MLELTYRHIRDIECKVNILAQGFAEVSDITRRQCFIILACMFLGILPKQMHEEQKLLTTHCGVKNQITSTFTLQAIMCPFKASCC